MTMLVSNIAFKELCGPILNVEEISRAMKAGGESPQFITDCEFKYVCFHQTLFIPNQHFFCKPAREYFSMLKNSLLIGIDV